jgi:hypothetical protein
MIKLDIRKYQKFRQECYNNSKFRNAYDWVEALRIAGFKTAISYDGSSTGIHLSEEEYTWFVIRWS